MLVFRSKGIALNIDDIKRVCSKDDNKNCDNGEGFGISAEIEKLSSLGDSKKENK